MASYGLLTPLWFGGGSFDQVFGMIAMTLLFGTGFAYAGMLLIGLPAFAILKRLRSETGLAYLCVGATSLPVLLTYRDVPTPSLAQFAFAGLPGLLVATWWWWWFASRP